MSSTSDSATTPTVLRATNSADFLAALPRMTGINAPNSCHVVLFGGKPNNSNTRTNRTLGSARLDLPTSDQLSDPAAMMAWAAQVATLSARADSAVIVLDTDATLPGSPSDSPYGLLAMLVKLAGEALVGAGSVHTPKFKDVLLVGANGWASLLNHGPATLRSLDEITSSPLHDPNHKALSLDDWRAAHPDQTTEDLTEIDSMTDRMLKSAGRRA
ncbi:hypothetical protein ACXR2T_09770 [Leucobacter sp. HY1910]